MDLELYEGKYVHFGWTIPLMLLFFWKLIEDGYYEL